MHLAFLSFPAGKIHISEDTRNFLAVNGEFDIEDRGMQNIKVFEQLNRQIH